jgi:hypothetical protein
MIAIGVCKMENNNDNFKLRQARLRKQAGEVRFVKDNSNSTDGWAWGGYTPSERKNVAEYEFNYKCSKDLAKVLRATLFSLGHAMSAYTIFAKLKSRDVSPDGNLGGKGYIQEIKTMRKQYMNIVEALSSLTDTLYDEIKAPHWSMKSREAEKVIDQVEEVKDDPEGWAQEVEAEPPAITENIAEDSIPPMMRTASFKRPSPLRIADLYMKGNK